MRGCGETRDAVAGLYPTAEEVRITCAIVDAAARVRDLNFKYLAEGKGATVTARFGPDGITFAIRTARERDRARCFSGFTTRRFECCSGASMHYQELTLL